MIDWLTSQIAVSIGAMMMIAGIVGYFVAQNNVIQGDEVAEILRALVEKIDSISAINGNTTLNVTFDINRASSDFYLKPTIKDSHYSFQFYSSGSRKEIETGINRPYFRILIKIEKQDSLEQDKDCINSFHIWKPTKYGYTSTELSQLDNTPDSARPSIVFSTGGGFPNVTKTFSIQRALIIVGGVEEYNTFVYK